MAVSLKDFVAEYSVDGVRVDAHKERMLAEVRAYGPREADGCLTWGVERQNASELNSDD